MRSFNFSLKLERNCFRSLGLPLNGKCYTRYTYVCSFKGLEHLDCRPRKEWRRENLNKVRVEKEAARKIVRELAESAQDFTTFLDTKLGGKTCSKRGLKNFLVLYNV